MKRIWLLFLLTSLGATAQTKLISHKSHRGSEANFSIAFENALFDLPLSNMGEAPVSRVRNAQLDTVVYISEEKAVMITSEVCEIRARFAADSLLNKTFWRAGRDTVYNHPLFSKRMALDSIKEVLTQEYHFQNDIEEVVFIGYVEKEHHVDRDEKKRRNNAFYILSGEWGGLKRVLMLCSLFACVVYAGFLGYTYLSKKVRRS